MATPTNPYYSQIYSPSLMTWGDQEAGTPVFSGKYNVTPYSGDFNAWAREYTDPAYRAQFAYADPGYDGGAGMGTGTKSLNALPSFWNLALSGYFDQFGQLTPEQQDWLGTNIANEQHVISGNNVVGGLGANDLAVLSVLAGPAIGAYTAPASTASGAGAAGAGGTAAGASEAAIADALASGTSVTGGGAALTAAPSAATGAAALGGAAVAADPFGGVDNAAISGGDYVASSADPYIYAGETALGGEALGGGGALAATAASGGSGGSSGGGSGSGSAGVSGGGSGSSGFFGLQDDEWLRRLSYGIPGLLGAIGAGAQAEDFEDLSHQYQQMGEPYRSRLSQLYANPEAFLNSPEVRQPIQQGTDMLARSLSVKGNPAGSGNALQELQNYASTQLFNRLGQEKDRLGGFGGLTAYNQAAPQAASNALSAQGNIYSNLGGATADIFNPPRRYDLRDFMRNYA